MPNRLALGIVLGRLLPGPFQALGRMTVAEVNIPVAVLIWLKPSPHRTVIWISCVAVPV